MRKNDERWLSLHLFSEVDLDHVLLEVVDPTVNELESQSLIRSMFFIRYWNGGPHIRLRLLSDESDGEQLAEVFRERLRWAAPTSVPRMFEMDYLRYARKLTEADRKATLLGYREPEQVEPFRVERAVEIRRYELDQGRYWWAPCDVIERHFSNSSAFVLQILRLIAGFQAARVALAVHLASVSYNFLNLDQERAAEFFRLAASELHSGTSLEASLGSLFEEDALRALAREVCEGEVSANRANWISELIEIWSSELKEQYTFIARHARGSRWEQIALLDLTHLMLNRLGISVDLEACVYHTIAAALCRPGA